ncbi:MAG: TIM44-like domain-containing protein [Betaproteobacteria bacterium]
MKRFLILSLAVFAALAVVAADSAEAKRLGGGRSLGTQRPATPSPSATPPSTTNVAPASPAAAASAMAAKAAPAASGASRWLGPLAGLAAGIGLAALLSHFGLSEGFASILMLVLLGLGALVLVRMFLARRTSTSPPMQYAGAGAGPNISPGASASLPPSIASQSGQFEPVFGGAAVAAAARVSGKYPAGFDPAPFVQQATLQFRKLQAAYDTGDRKALADVMTPDMYAEIEKEIAERSNHTPTEVSSLDATVLEVTTESDRHWASVHFQGTLREDGMLLPKPFDEIWNLVKPVSGNTGWLLAGIRQVA